MNDAIDNAIPTIVIYHANCADGFCAAWLIHRMNPSARFHAAHYGTRPPDSIDGAAVVIVDFSYPRTIMREIADRARSLVVLDHHATAEQELAGLAEEIRGHCPCHIVFDRSVSGALLAHRWLHGPAVPPCDLVEYVQDRDLWRWALPFSRPINAAIRSYPMTFDSWDSLYRQMPDFSGVPMTENHPLVAEGRAIERYQQLWSLLRRSVATPSP